MKVKRRRGPLEAVPLRRSRCVPELSVTFQLPLQACIVSMRAVPPQHVHDLVPFPTKDFDVSHTINQLSFGAPFPGRKSPLDGVVKGRPRDGMAVGSGMHQSAPPPRPPPRGPPPPPPPHLSCDRPSSDKSACACACAGLNLAGVAARH